MRFPFRWYEVAPSATTEGTTDLYRPEVPIRLIGRSGEAFVLRLSQFSLEFGVAAG